MKFIDAPPNIDFQNGHKVSEGGKWEIGLYTVMFGVRVNIAKVGACGSCVSLCAGNNPLVIALVYMCALQLMSEQPEEASETYIQKMFPEFQVRPINLDTENFCKLLLVSTPEQGKEAITLEEAEGYAEASARAFLGPAIIAMSKE